MKNHTHQIAIVGFLFFLRVCQNIVDSYPRYWALDVVFHVESHCAIYITLFYKDTVSKPIQV